MGSYVPGSAREREEMLHAIGLAQMTDLYRDCLLYTSRCV